MNTYQEFADKTRSQKIVIAHLEARQRVKQFDLHSGTVYVKDSSLFIVGIQVNGSQLAQGSSPVLNSGEFFFSSGEGKIYVRMSDDSNPKSKSIWMQTRFFFSNIDCILPSEITSGELVHYDSRIKDIGDLKLELDFENTGIALETNSNISLHNNDGFFDDIFDTLIWENNKAKFWSWSKSLPYDQARCIYLGLITDKSFTSQQVKFNLKDQLTQLRQSLDVERFTESDGEFESSILNKPKRTIFGRVNKIRTQGVDKTLDGFVLTGLVTGSANRSLMNGTVSALVGTNNVTGIGTNFTTLEVGDRILITGPLSESSFEVATITSSTQLTVTTPFVQSFVDAQIRDLQILNNIITGVGSIFIDEVSPDDQIVVEIDGVDTSFTVETVDSQTQITLTDEIDVGFESVTVKNSPSIPYRKKNRLWNVAGHKLREYSTSIVTIINFTNIEVADIGDIEFDDTLVINGKPYIVLSRIGNKIRLNQGLIGSVTVGMSVTKIPVSSAYVGKQRFIIDRDFTVTNTTNNAVISFRDTAEFNVAKSRFPTVQLDFTQGSTIVKSASVYVDVEYYDKDLTTLFKPRDWIKIRSVNFPEWYEILSVRQTEITLRSPVITTSTNVCEMKSPEYISDDSLVTADCLGMDTGDWIRSPAQAVKWILEKSGFTDFNSASFIQAEDDCQYTLALYYPETLGSEFPVVRDMITNINQSCFGSLFLDNDFKFTFNILNADKPEDLEVLRDEDIISFSVTTKNNIINSILLNFHPYVDTESGSETTKQMILNSDFVDEAVGKKERLTRTAYLYHEEDAKIVAERWLFFRSLNQTVVNVRSKLKLSGKSLNDKVFLDLSRLFKRFGGRDRRKIGIINSISKDGSDTEIEFNDLGNIFNRVPAICPDVTADYIEGTEDVVRWGFITDNESETPDPESETGLGTNLIG